MRAGIFFYQDGDTHHGRVARRADRHEQTDTRGQYPRPRDNEFAQQPRRVQARPQPMPEQPTQPQLQSQPTREVFSDGASQYEQPAAPYVPGFMRGTQYPAQYPPRDPESAERPVQQGDYIRQQNPYTVLSEKSTDATPVVKQRTLIVFTVLAAFILAGLWVGQLIFSAQTEAVYASRAAAAKTVADKHPFSYRDLIETQATKNNLHPAFVAAIVLNESSFNPSAESYKGARGLMQMMPDTAEWVYDQIGNGTGYTFDLMYNAEQNVTYGCWYVAYLSDKFGGDPVLVAAAFHSGQTNVYNWLNNSAYSSDQKTIKLENLPDGNTKAYVQKVINAFAAYRRLYYEEVNS